MQQKLSDFFDPASKRTNFQPARIPFQEFLSKSEKYQGRATVQSSVEWGVIHTNWMDVNYDGWTMPATKEKYPECGTWKTRGCLNTENHEKFGYDHAVYVQRYQYSCYRPSCKTCYYQSIIRQANRSAQRITAYSTRFGKPILSIIFSLPQSDYGLTFEEMKEKLARILKDLEIIGSAVVFHAFRFNKNESRWYYSPHFHVLGFPAMTRNCTIRLKKMKYVLYKKYYWLIIPKNSPWSVFQLFCYLFSHAGIKKGYRRVTWLGVLSYSKLKLEKEPPTNICPCCKVKLVPIRYEEYGCPIAPAQYFAGFIDPGGWYEEKIGEESTDRYEYAPVKHADSILKGLATAN